MKKLLLISVGLLLPAITAFSQPPPEFTQSNVQGLGYISYSTPQDYITALTVTCDCVSKTWEWDGKRWNPVYDNFQANPVIYVTNYFLPQPPGICQEFAVVEKQASIVLSHVYLYPTGSVEDPGVGTRWKASWFFYVPYVRSDDWREYCDGSAQEYDRKVDDGLC
jgi:hypothetical protein